MYLIAGKEELGKRDKQCHITKQLVHSFSLTSGLVNLRK